MPSDSQLRIFKSHQERQAVAAWTAIRTARQHLAVEKKRLLDAVLALEKANIPSTKGNSLDHLAMAYTTLHEAEKALAKITELLVKTDASGVAFGAAPVGGSQKASSRLRNLR